MEVGTMGSWAGGTTYVTGQGATRWVIRRMVDGKRYVRVLRRDGRGKPILNETAAEAELAKFMADPDAYVAARTRPPAKRAARAASTWDRIEDWAADLGRRQRTPEYVESARKYVEGWRDALGGKALETCSLLDLKRALKRWKSGGKGRVIALKSFTGYLRREGAIPRAADPSLDLPVPPSVSRRLPGERSYPAATVEGVYARIASQAVRDVYRIRAMTGCHTTEVARAITRLAVVDDPSGIYGTMTAIHKSGKPHVWSLDRQTYEAAVRLARDGMPGKSTIFDALTAAEPGFTIERLRHTFTTLARTQGRVVSPTEGGIPAAKVAELLGHSVDTASKYYADVTVPPMAVIPLTLTHAADPA